MLVTNFQIHKHVMHRMKTQRVLYAKSVEVNRAFLRAEDVRFYNLPTSLPIGSHHEHRRYADKQ